MTGGLAIFPAIPVDNHQKSVYISATKLSFFWSYCRKRLMDMQIIKYYQTDTRKSTAGGSPLFFGM
jgi:hypothetical protein